MPTAWLHALGGGLLIGLAASLMLYWNGRVTGVSGILNSSLRLRGPDRAWRLCFLAGLFVGGMGLVNWNAAFFTGQLDSDLWTVCLAGLLVGFGTVLGNGCTSGHGVCGISRLSPRSIVATLLFIGAGVASVVLFKAIGVL